MGAFFEGTAVTILMTIERLLSLPEDTLVFPGHEYSDTTLKFALLMEANNPDLLAKAAWVEMRRKKFYCTVPSTLSEERSYNPFLRIRSPAILTVTKTATPMKALVALQNNRISKRNEYKNIALVKPEQLGVNDHRVAA
jgi:hydroxyacylglutathione hydrolase